MGRCAAWTFRTCGSVAVTDRITQLAECPRTSRPAHSKTRARSPVTLATAGQHARQISLARHVRDRSRVGRRDEGGNVAVPRLDLDRIAIDGVVARDAGDASQRTRKPVDVICATSRYDERTTLRRVRHRTRQSLGMHRVGRSQAQVDELSTFISRPLNRPHEHVDIRRQLPMKDLGREQFDRGRLLANRRGNGGAVANAIENVVVAVVWNERHAAPNRRQRVGDPRARRCRALRR